MRRTLLLILMVAMVVPGMAATAGADGRLPRQRVYRDGVDAHRQVDVLRVVTNSESRFESNPHYVEIRKRTKFRRGDHVTVWINIDRDRRPEGRIDHWPFQRRVEVRRVHGWGTKWRPMARPGLCLDTDGASPNFGGRNWGVQFAAWCFDKRGHGRLGRSWSATVRVVDGRHHDGAPGAFRWMKRIRRASD